MTRQPRVDYQTAFFQGRDGVSLFEQTWQPRRVSGLVAIVHGIAEHGGRYARLAQALCSAGYATSVYDLRGHGRSAGAPVFVRSFDAHLDDLDIFLERARSRCAGQPLFLLGHSMGGQVAALYAIERQPDLDGLALSAPAVRTGLDTPVVLVNLLRTLNKLLPRLPLLKLGSADISRDLDVVSAYDHDPLVFRGGLPAATLLAFRDATHRIQRGIERLSLPLLVLHGSADPLVDPQGSRELVARASSTDKTLHLYEGLYHEVFNEPERERVIHDLIAWLDAHRP